jgi:hypothetical protein
MPSIAKRAEFPKRIVRTVAERAHHQCSFPGCERVTIGPGVSVDRALTTGKAAHIFSARDGRPRGDGGLTFEQRQSIENAIWLCSGHADRIDKNNGLEFPAPMLKAYKQLHEAKVRRERDGSGAERGWLHSLVLERAPVFNTPSEIQFGKVTVLHGNNHSGKTALCDWLQGVSEPGTLISWADAKRPGNLLYQVTYFDPFPQKVRVRVSAHDEIEYFVNGEPVPFNPNPIRFIRLKDLTLHRFTDELPTMTDLEFLTKTFSLNTALVRNTLHHVGGNTGSTVVGLRLHHDDNNGAVRIWTDIHGNAPSLAARGFSQWMPRSIKTCDV